MTRLHLILVIMISLWVTAAFSTDLAVTDDAPDHNGNNDVAFRHTIGSTLCMLRNIGADKPIYFGQLNYGYRLTPKDNLLVEAITNTYYKPLGANDSSDDSYPGKVLAVGVGLGYQRFLWKNSFASVVATPYFQRFYDEEDKKIQDGLQLYVHGTVGYRFEFFKKRWFLEPMVGVALLPVNTNVPDSFAEIDSGKPDYAFEPRIKFGYTF
ncbi:MAG: hypothetical protein PHO32_04875 [Candidatus Cloacimonetes bacterium]|nr:hypothetical protein [Candidatus Cloacimonadota bacterium]